MKKSIFVIVSIFILASCGENNTESDKSRTEKQKSQQLLSTSSDSVAILEGKVINSVRSATVYKWGTSYNYICFQPVKSYNGAFNNDLFAIDFETHWKMDSIHGQVDTDSLPFLKDKNYILQLNLMKVDSGAYFDTTHIIYLYKLVGFIDAESKDKDSMIKQWIENKNKY